MLQLFAPFNDQSRSAHLALVVAGASAFLLGAYGTAFLLYDGTSTFVAAGSGAVAARRAALAVGATCCWLTFAVGFLRTIGGPVLNYVWYPLGILVVATGPGYPFLFGSPPGSVYTGAAMVFSPRGIIDSPILILPGALLAASLLVAALVLRLDSEEAQREWMDRHLPESFLEAYHPLYDHGEWTDE